MTRTRKLTSAILTLFVVLVAACNPAPPTGSSGGGQLVAPSDQAADPLARWNQTLAAAKQEGKLVVTTHTNLYFRQQIETFQAKFPEIQVEHVAIRPSEFTPKVITEQQNGVFGYDVWVSPTSSMVENVVPVGGFQDISQFLIHPEVAEGQNWRTGRVFYATNDPLIVLYRGNVTGGAWVNRDIVPASEFSRIDQLVDPKFREKIAIRTPNISHQGSLSLAGMFKAKGQDFINKLMDEQKPIYIENARLLTQNLISGRYGIAMGVDNETLDACKREGGCRNIEQVVGDEYLLGYGVGVLKNAPHPNAAAVFANWFLSKEGQQSLVDHVVATTPSPHDDAHSARVDVQPHPEALASGSVPDYSNLSKYSLQGTEAGATDMQAVLATYRRIEATR